jgi:hypothetical protein
LELAEASFRITGERIARSDAAMSIIDILFLPLDLMMGSNDFCWGSIPSMNGVSAGAMREFAKTWPTAFGPKQFSRRALNFGYETTQASFHQMSSREPRFR